MYILSLSFVLFILSLFRSVISLSLEVRVDRKVIEDPELESDVRNELLIIIS